MTINGPASTNCQVRITCFDATQNSSMAESATFSIVMDTEPPTIELLSPISAELIIGTDFQFEWNAQDNVSVTRVLIEILRNGSADTLADLVAAGNTYTWTVCGPAGTNNSFRLTAFDAANNSASAESGSFSISDQAPIPPNTLRLLVNNVYKQQAGTKWRGYDDVTVVDENDNAVYKATVKVDYAGPTNGSDSDRTNNDGVAELITKKTKHLNGQELCFEIADVTKNGYTY